MPYKGSAPAIADLLGGRDVMVSFASMASVVPHIKAGKLKALTVTTANRLAAVPDVPTTAESGFPSLVIYSWNGVFAPVGTRPELITRINREIHGIVHAPDVVTLLTSLGLDATGGTPAHFSELIKADLQRWAKIIKDAGIKKAQL